MHANARLSLKGCELLIDRVADSVVAGRVVNGVSITADAEIADVYHADTITVTDANAGVSSASNPFNVHN